jgi:hypothetical protein
MSLRRRSWQLWWWLVRFHDSPWCNTEGARGWPQWCLAWRWRPESTVTNAKRQRRWLRVGAQRQEEKSHFDSVDATQGIRVACRLTWAARNGGWVGTGRWRGWSAGTAWRRSWRCGTVGPLGQRGRRSWWVAPSVCWDSVGASLGVVAHTQRFDAQSGLRPNPQQWANMAGWPWAPSRLQYHHGCCNSQPNSLSIQDRIRPPHDLDL